ncbi:MAG: YraN family protein [Nitrospirae bacterium YQR-1]
MNNVATGKQGEKLAGEFIKKLGYQILEKNYKNKIGEIDIIAKDGDCVVFIEVKTRLNDTFGMPVEAVNFRKIHKIKNTALIYMKTLDNPAAVRFDVISVMIGAKQYQIEHIKGAFEG